MFNNSLLNTFLSNCLFSIISFVYVYVFFLICLFSLTMSYSSLITGSLIVNFVPLPRSLSTEMSPWCKMTIFLT